MQERIFVDSGEALEATYHRLIPISQHMGISVRDYNGSALTIAAPLANNINHQMTAFGGSLFSLAALAGWGLMQLKLSEHDLDGNTVIAGGDVGYASPVADELVCTCPVPPEFDAFIDRLKERGRAGIAMPSVFTADDGEAAMNFNGKYVVRLRRKD